MRRLLWNENAMVVAQSPLRVDFCGMTDYIPSESWCVNATLKGLIARLRLEAREDNKININVGSYGNEQFTLDDINESSNMFMKALSLYNYTEKFDFGMNVNVNCEFGAIGLSSSSSVASLYNVALALICNNPYDPLDIAIKTQAIEPHWYGRQDQLAVSFGGFNLWHLTPGAINQNGIASSFGNVERYPIILPHWIYDVLVNDVFLIYDSYIDEGASQILYNVANGYETNSNTKLVFSDLNNLAKDVYCILTKPNKNWLYDLGEIFTEIRKAHEKLHPSVSNDRMQKLFNAAKKAGALGGRYSGAGGRGALTFVCKPGETAKVVNELNNVITSDGATFTRGGQIHFGGFSDSHAAAWYISKFE